MKRRKAAGAYNLLGNAGWNLVREFTGNVRGGKERIAFWVRTNVTSLIGPRTSGGKPVVRAILYLCNLYHRSREISCCFC